MEIQSGGEKMRNAGGQQGENERKKWLHVQFVFLLIRSTTLEAIFIVVPRLASHDLIFFVYTYY